MLQEADIAFDTGEETHRPARLLALFRRDLRLEHFPLALLRERPGWDGAFARTIGDLEAAFARAKAADRTYVIVIDVHAHQWTPGDAWWDVGVPEVSARYQMSPARSHA